MAPDSSKPKYPIADHYCLTQRTPDHLSQWPSVSLADDLESRCRCVHPDDPEHGHRETVWRETSGIAGYNLQKKKRTLSDRLKAILEIILDFLCDL